MTRRTTHPLALPPRDGSPNPQVEARVAEVVTGPQHALCQHTRCCVCWAVATLLGRHGPRRFTVEEARAAAPDAIYYHAVDLDWHDLPTYDPSLRVSDGHHEPFRSHGGTDSKCVSLCPPHHNGGLPLDRSAGIWTARHHTSYRAFWGFYGFLRVREDGATVLEAVQREMQRRARER